MSTDLTVVQDSINVDNEVVIDVVVDAPVEVNTATSTLVEVIPDNYVLTSNGIFTGNLDGSVPLWLTNAIQVELTTGDGNITNVVNDLAQLVNTLQIGVNQNITNIQNTDLSVAALETSVVSRLDGNDASILNLDLTKVDEAGATAISADVISSTFSGNVDAYISGIAATYVEPGSAIATDVAVIAASVNDTNASVTRIDEAIVDTTRLNPLWVDDGIQTDPDVGGEPRYLVEARAKSSLELDVNGHISGFVAENDGSISDFTIVADRFKVQGTASGYTPIAVDATTGKLKFTGDVRFEGLGLDGTSTTINGGYIDATALSVITANLGTINAGVMYSSLNAAGTGPSTALDYAMKIDLNNGEIHIR